MKKSQKSFIFQNGSKDGNSYLSDVLHNLVLHQKKFLISAFLLFSFAFDIKAQNWNLIWSDEFSGTTINSNNWKFETGGGGWGNSELEYYTSRPENAIIHNDTLLIIARKESYNGSNYTSARMITQGLQNFTYGKIEASIKIPVGKGMWPAFWMLGKSISQVGWPACGEIDIMEHVNTDNILYGTIHWDNNGHAQYGGNTTFNTSKFHTFGIEWDSAAIRWYLDGTKYHEANILNNINSTDEFHQPFFILLNLAVGGQWPGNPDATTSFPDTMYVDYVRVYQKTNATAPLATITSSGITNFCSGDSLVLNANAGTGYTYQWKKGGTNISGATGIKYTAKTSGSYTVTVTSGGLSTTSSAIAVTVNSIPSAPTTNSPVTYCQNAIATALSATGASLKWYTVSSGGSGSGTAPTPVTTSPGTTNYYVSQTTNNCESARSTIAVTINSIPSAPTTNSPVTYCQNSSATALTATGTSLKWYTVSTGGSGSGTAPTPVTTSAGTTNYYVSQTTNNCESTRSTIAVTINSIPSAPTSNSPVTYCQNSSATALTATGTSLKWYTLSTGGSGSGTAPTPVTTSVGTTNYYVSQTNNGCESSRAMISVDVNPIPPATITVNGNTTIVDGQTVTLNANTGTGFSYQWFKGNTEIGTGPSYTTSSAGDYSVAVTNNLGCASHSSVTTISVTPNQPSVISITSLTNNANVQAPVTISANVTDPDGAIVLVEFLDGNTVIGSTTTQPYSFTWMDPSTGTHTISVRATDIYGGVTTSDPITVNIGLSAGIQNAANTLFGEVYPIPARNEVTVVTKLDLAGAIFRLTNAIGVEVVLNEINIDGSSAKLNVSGFAEGVYVLMIKQNLEILTRKIIIIP